MADLKRVSNEQVREFYKDKDARPKVTSAYMKTGYGQRRGGYIEVAQNYINNETPICRSIKEYLTVSKTKKDEVNGNHQWGFLHEIGDEYELKSTKLTDGEPNQKWHLYVSVFAQAVVTETFDWKKCFKKYPCLQLKLWLAENAGVDLQNIEIAIKENAEKKTVNDLIRKIDWNCIYDRILESVKLSNEGV